MLILLFLVVWQFLSTNRADDRRLLFSTFVQDVDDNIRYVMRADCANAVVLGKLPDLGMPIERRISRPPPHAILCEYAYKSIDIMKVYRVAVDLYQPRTLVFDL